MFLSSAIAIVLFICRFTFYLTWGFTQIGELCQAIFDKTFSFKNILISVLYLLPLVLIDRFIPDYLDKYSDVSSYLTFGLIIWFGLASQAKYKNNMGELLFVSRSVSKRIYLVIPFTLLSLWAIYSNLRILSGETELLSSTDILMTKNYIYSLFICKVFVIVSVTICFYIFSWNKLEIRDKGICYISFITWKNIISYSLSEEKPNLLIIEYLNGYKKEIRSKIAIAPEEKEQIESIFKNKLKNVVE